MRRVVAAIAVVLACAGTAASAAPPRFATPVGTAQTLMPGVTYQKLVQFTPRGPVVYHVVIAPRPGGPYALRPLLSNGTIPGKERLTDMEKDAAAVANVVAVNGDLSSADGRPAGIVMSGGALQSVPATGRSSVGIDTTGTLRVDRISYNGYWKGSGQRRPLTLNAAPAPNTVTLYTPAFGPATPPETGPAQVEVLSSFPATAPNADLTAPVGSAQQAAGGIPIPPTGAVLVARGSQAPILAAEAPVGSSVLVRLTLTPSWAGVTDAIGGGPVLVRAGKAVFRANELFPSSLLTPRTARTAVGQLIDGRIVLVAVDGSQPGYSVGATNFELALAMQQLGCVTASALEPGGATALAFGGQLLNRPSDPGGERPLADALAVEYFGANAAPPAVGVVSPNGDGVDELQTLAYTIVRPSNVTASVVGPTGVTDPIDAGQRQPGTYTFTWSGILPDGTPEPEGRYQFAVTAVDDQGQSSTVTRTFVLDDTVGFLVSASKVTIRRNQAVALRATYQLTHPATVTTEIQTQSGVVVRTLGKASLQPGAQTVVWDGRVGSGLRAFGGSYQLVVTATNTLGTATLRAPFTARRA